MITLGTQPRRGPGGPRVLWPAAKANTPMTAAVSEDIAGHGASAAATSGGADTERLSSQWLRGLVDEVAAAGRGAVSAREGLSPGPELGQYCLSVVEHVTNALFGPRIIGRPSAGPSAGGIAGGIRTKVVRDDGLLHAGEPARRQLGLPATAWIPLQKWETVVTQVRAAGPGAAAFAVIEQPGTGQAIELHHAVALVHTTDIDNDGRNVVVLIDPATPGQATITPVSDNTTWPRPINARTVLINAAGNVTSEVITPDRTVPPESGSTARALTHPTHPRIGMHPHRQGPPHSHTPAQPDTPQPGSSRHPAGGPPPHIAPAPQPPAPSRPAWWGYDSQPPTVAEQQPELGRYYELAPALAKHFYRRPPWSNAREVDIFARRNLQELQNEADAASRIRKEQRFADIAARAGVQSALSDDVIRELMTDSLRHEYPEVENLYLHRRVTSNTIDSNYVIWATRAVPVGDTQISVQYDPTSPRPWLETRIEWTRRAIQHVKAAGFTVSNLEVTIPKYTRILKIELAPGNSWMGRSELQITATPILEGEARTFGRFGMIIGSNLESLRHKMSPAKGASGRYEEVEVGILVHEIGHAESDLFRYADIANTALIDPSKIAQIAAISDYAALGPNPGEFVAEYFVGLVFGRPYDLELPRQTAAYLQELYDDLGGPQPQFTRQEEDFPPPIPLDREKLAFVVDQVNQTLRSRGSRLVAEHTGVTHIHDRLSPYERKLTLDQRATLIVKNHMADAGHAALPPADLTQPEWPAGHQAAARLGVRLNPPQHNNHQLIPVLLNTMLATGTGPHTLTEQTLRQGLAATLNTLVNHPPEWAAQARAYLLHSHPNVNWPETYTALQTGEGDLPSHDPIALFLAAISLNIQIHHITDHGNVRSVGSPNAPEVALAQINGQWIATHPYPDPHLLTQAVNALFPTTYIPQNDVMAISKTLAGFGYEFTGNLEDWAWAIAQHLSVPW